MRRLLVIGSVAAVVAFGAACGNNDDEGGQALPPSANNTAEVCAEAESAQANEMLEFEEELTALQQEGLDEEEFEQAALESMQSALVGWSDGLQEQAERADDPELTEALSGLADGLADAAPQLTVESVRTGEIPNAEELNAYGERLTEICAPAAPATP